VSRCPATPLAFGEVALSGVTTGATPGTATITVNCTGGGAYTVALDSGLNNVAAARNLKSGSNLSLWPIYRCGSRTVWPSLPRSRHRHAAAQTLTVFA